jgi:hypothetical protein
MAKKSSKKGMRSAPSSSSSFKPSAALQAKQPKQHSSWGKIFVLLILLGILIFVAVKLSEKVKDAKDAAAKRRAEEEERRKKAGGVIKEEGEEGDMGWVAWAVAGVIVFLGVIFVIVRFRKKIMSILQGLNPFSDSSSSSSFSDSGSVYHSSPPPLSSQNNFRHSSSPTFSSQLQHTELDVEDDVRNVVDEIVEGAVKNGGQVMEDDASQVEDDVDEFIDHSKRKSSRVSPIPIEEKI